MTEQTQELIAVGDVEGNGELRSYDVRTLNANNTKSYHSLKGGSIEEKKKLYNAANSPDEKLADFINKKIIISDVYAETVELANEETGELQSVPRVVLISPDGTSYGCVSVGIFSALETLITVFGEPTWEEPIEITVIQVKVGKGNSMLSLKF